MTPESIGSVAIVAIGRNEGARLKACLRAALATAHAVVYVDSGSSDGSAEFARSLGCDVVELTPPLSAARARNEGFARARQFAPDAELIQFLDGDCTLVDGWLAQGLAALQARPDAAIVFGHVREVHPEASIYNRLFDLEWRHEPGEVGACGGIFMVRAAAFAAVGGFRPEVIAAEDNEFCLRIRRTGAKIILLDAPMVGHDAATYHVIQWWRRARRTGHAYAQVAALHGDGSERYFVRECRRVWVWGFLLPGFALVLAPFTRGWSLLLLGFYCVQFLRILRSGRRRGWPQGDAAVYAFFTVLAKFPAFEGMMAFYWRRMMGQTPTIMEHKES